MKVNEAPERIWINSPQDLPCSSVDSNSIEYIRINVFIEKACDWLKTNVTYTHPRTGETKCVVNLNAFRDAMKGE